MLATTLCRTAPLILSLAIVGIATNVALAAPAPSEATQALDSLWADLASADDAKVTLAILKLGATPQQTMAFIKDKLGPVKADAERVAKLIAQLDDNDFTTRQRAADELEYLGKFIQADLEKTLKGNASAETKQRIQQLINKLPKPIQAKEMPPQAQPGVNRVAVINGRVIINGVEVNAQPVAPVTPQGPSMTWVRAVRAIAVLEHIGTPEARQIIQAISKGEADALPTKEARAALDRLK